MAKRVTRTTYARFDGLLVLERIPVPFSCCSYVLCICEMLKKGSWLAGWSASCLDVAYVFLVCSRIVVRILDRFLFPLASIRALDGFVLLGLLGLLIPTA